MSRHIDADAALKRFWEHVEEQRVHPKENAFNAEWVDSFIDSRPTADVEEVRHGKWIKARPSKFQNQLSRCSKCGYELLNDFIIAGEAKYCQNCGAKMDGGTK